MYLCFVFNLLGGQNTDKEPFGYLHYFPFTEVMVSNKLNTLKYIGTFTVLSKMLSQLEIFMEIPDDAQFPTCNPPYYQLPKYGDFEYVFVNQTVTFEAVVDHGSNLTFMWLFSIYDEEEDPIMDFGFGCSLQDCTASIQVCETW